MNTKLLKQKILDLAIRGKLVPQDPNDEPASELLKRIRAEKEKLIAEGKIKRSKKTGDKPHYENENAPFEIPESWEWVKLDELAQYKKGPFGSSLTKAMFVKEGVDTFKVYEQKNAIQKDSTIGTYYISKEHFERLNAFEVQPNDIIVSCAGTIGETYILPKDIKRGVINQALMFVRLYLPIITPFYLIYFDFIIKSSSQQDSKGTAIKNIPPFEILKNYLFPLPPLQEQERIIAEVEKWFALIDKIEDNKQDLQDYIKQTKSKILSLAIHGKLVPQDSNDEPAIELLKRINPAIKPCDTSHYGNLPKGWAICKLNDIAKITAGGTPSRKITSYWDGGTIPWLKIADMTTSGKYVRTASEYITEEGMKNSSAKLMRKGTLLYTIFASIGEVGILDFDATCNQAIANIDLYMTEMTDYIYYYLKNLQAYMYSISKGCTQQNINQGILKSATIPLPPIAEQKRIVERIGNIFNQLDQITAEL